MKIQKKQIKYLRNKLSTKQIDYLRVFRDTYRNFFDPYPYRKYTKKYNSIFIHIPKTAGTSILKNMGGWAGDHCTYREYLQASPTKFEKYFKFCFIRNPYDRLVSAYEYLKQGGNQTTDKNIQKLILTKYVTFEKFVVLYLDKNTIYRVNLLKPQYWFIYDEHSNLMVDHIAKYENLDEEFLFISEKLKLSDINLQKTNKSTKEYSNYNEYYTQDMKNKVYNLYELDFELLGYKK